jgi:hypothetical protein
MNTDSVVQNSVSRFVTTKRKKVLLTISLLALATVAFFALRPRNEPKYEGRYLSDWVSEYARTTFDDMGTPEANRAMAAMGTNALTQMVAWMRYEQPLWKERIYHKLHNWVQNRGLVAKALGVTARERADDCRVIFFGLGTNAVSAIPALTAMLQETNQPMSAYRAQAALAGIGKPALPVLQAAFDRPGQPHRAGVFKWLLSSTRTHDPDRQETLLVKGLTDKDAAVREHAKENALYLAPYLLTNAPAQ